jgi:hypothetical protein
LSHCTAASCQMHISAGRYLTKISRKFVVRSIDSSPETK